MKKANALMKDIYYQNIQKNTNKKIFLGYLRIMDLQESTNKISDLLTSKIAQQEKMQISELQENTR